MTKVKHLKILQAWAERQRQILREIERNGFDEVIDSGETYEEWLEFELRYVYELIDGRCIQGLEHLLENDIAEEITKNIQKENVNE